MFTTEQQQQILDLRLSGVSLAEVATRFNVTRLDIRKLESKLLRGIKRGEILTEKHTLPR